MDACDENFALSINILAFEGSWCHRRCRTCSVSGSFSRPQNQLRTIRPKMRLPLWKKWFYDRQGKETRSARLTRKRWEGSSQEGNSAVKKQNMAARGASPDNNDAENVFEPSEEEETVSLHKIKALLEGVQQTILEIRTELENQRMAAELMELKSSLNKHSTELST